MPKVKYGLKNVHFVPGVLNDDGSATFEATVYRWPGAVSMNLEAVGEATKFRADNIDYWVGQSNSGYEGDFESALIPDTFREKVLGEVKDANEVAYERVSAPTKIFAFMFQFENDDSATRHIMYNCTASRPAVTGQTTEETLEPQTETITMTAASIYVPELDESIVKARAQKGTAKYDTWFDAVYIPGAAPAQTFTVTFDSDGGTDVPAQTVQAGGVATEPTAPTRGTDTFDGWFLNGTAYDFSTPVTADITLVAQWS